MIFGKSSEPDHHYEEYINFDGDDADFIQTENYCIFDEDGVDVPCLDCGQCEEKTFACSEDEYDNTDMEESL